MDKPEFGAVATVTSYTNGSYHRNYKLDWHRDVEAGTMLYSLADMERFALSVRDAGFKRVANEDKLYEIIRGFGYTTRGQTDEIVAAIVAMMNSQSEG